MFRGMQWLCLSSVLWVQASLASSPFHLSERCPAYFEKLTDGSCQLRTLYDFYDSPQQHGGVRANLPQLPTRFTPEVIDLGRYLFFDPLLSARRDMSCASCHQPDKSFSDGRKASLGAVENKRRSTLPRATPTLWNVGFLQRLMWDGRADDLAEQALLPLLSEVEMGNTREGVLLAVGESPAYQALFQQAFGDKPNLKNIGRALAAFQTSLVSFNSRYDRYAHGDQEAMSQKEIEGYNVFRGFVARCSQCHVPPLFTDGEVAVVGAPADENGFVDAGAGTLSDDPFVMGGFRVPTLRNIEKSAPYFHNGAFDRLEDVLNFYNNTRGHMAPADQTLKIHWHVHMTQGPKLSVEDIDSVEAFLKTLNDESSMPPIPRELPSGLKLISTLEEG